MDHHLITGVTGSTLVDGAVPFATLNQHSEYQGFGPRFGLDTSYDMGNGFSFVGHSSAVLLVGDLDSGAVQTTNAAATNASVTTNGSSDHQVVPGAEGKLAVRYDHPMEGMLTGTNGTLSLEGGWRWNWWHNVIEQLSSRLSCLQQ